LAPTERHTVKVYLLPQPEEKGEGRGEAAGKGKVLRMNTFPEKNHIELPFCLPSKINYRMRML